MSKPKILVNGLIVSNGFRFIGSIVVNKGLISALDVGITDIATINPDEYDIYDCRGKFVLPGVIDEHVHFRDPGMTEKGDISTESRAAVAGGVTSFFDMPNTIPTTTSIEAWEKKMARAAEASECNYAFFLGATADNMREILNADYTRIPGVKFFLGSSTGGMLMGDEKSVRRLFEQFPGVIACHAESEQIIAENRRIYAEKYPEGIPLKYHSEIRSRKACLEATRRAVELARQTGARLHVMHVSTADELQFFTPGSVDGERITAETCPHYLLLNEDSVERTGGLTKCNPALKTEQDRRALLRALADGRINTIGSDHAPHQLSLKRRGDAITAPSGMPSVQFVLPLMMQLAMKGHFSLETVVDRMCAAPARLYNISRRGFIRQNFMADIVVVNPDDEYEITRDMVLSRCGWSPYEGMKVKFRVEQTWVNGQLAYDHGRFTGEQKALAVRFNV